MAQLSDDCFAFGDGLLPLDDALRIIADRVRPVVGREAVALAEADGRILAADIVSGLDLPPFANSAVDGYAVRFDDLSPDRDTRLPVAGRVAAGHRVPSGPGGVAIRIFTGAAMPTGFDTVFMQEDVPLDGEGRAALPHGLKRGANRRLAGEDLARGGLALAAGRRLGPAEIALLAAIGVAEIEVQGRLRVALFSTGDELAGGDGPLAAGRIHDANRPMLRALLGRRGCIVSDLGVLPDRREAVGAALAAAAGAHDLLVTSGGVSTGEEDHVRAAVSALGSVTFWRLGIKPGRPVALGLVSGTPLIGLPGNPVAAFVTFAFLARPLLARLMGETYRPPVATPVRSGFRYGKKAGRREYVRVRLERDGEGGLVARKHPRDGAGIITSLTETDGLVELPEDVLQVEPGDPIGFIAYDALR